MNNHRRNIMHIYASGGGGLIATMCFDDHAGVGTWLFISSILYAAIGAMRGTQI